MIRRTAPYDRSFPIANTLARPMLDDLVADFIAAWADRRPDSGNNICRITTERTAQLLERSLPNQPNAAAPTSVNDTQRMGAPVVEHQRRTVRDDRT